MGRDEPFEVFREGAELARQRAAQARAAAARARKRARELDEARGSLLGPAEAEERRILAEERLAELEVTLAQARQRSVNAHERAARLDAAVGLQGDAERHQDAADRERQLIDDEAVRVARRHRIAEDRRGDPGT